MGRHRSFKLKWSRYYQFLIEGQIFYLKLKAYTNRNEGVKEWELITEQTYKEAMKKGRKDNLVIVEDEVSIVPVQALTLILNRIYGINERDMRTAVVEAQESIRELRKHTEIRFELEYRVFKRIVEIQVKEFKEDYSRGIAI
ncbi:hypothetical protein NSA23_03720 [Anaerosalibacter massiliensis]|uniref:Uncharacterized protein n=1 Tax=Anaerosalibacter massiliensis TaxID=1347392 RepID=A0A9X2ML37_9FIRM|nr:hypothetical protein [Anaerosalibacter massiliensis]MCR2043221.1 hypothetical protein [Anaerosalibacter massiliensis]